MKVPFFNYAARYKEDREKIKEIVYQVGTSDQFILKEHAAELEDNIRAYTGAKHAIATANGTAALTLILRAMGVGPGVDVLTPAFSFISTASTIALLGARPVFVDVDPLTGMMDPADLEARVTPKSKVVIPTHLFSVMADMAAINEVAKRNGLLVLEDSAVMLGARMQGKPAGMHGDAGLYSFFPAKPLGGIGDGAVIVTDDDELGRLCRMLRNHGQDGITRFLHHYTGYNHRMDETVAAYLVHKLKRFDSLLERRRQIGMRYDEAFAPLAPHVQVVKDAAYERVYYTYVLQAEYRDQLREYLAAREIETQVYYPRALPLQSAFAYLGHKPGDFPHAEAIPGKALALPLYAEMPDAHVEHVIETVLKFEEAVKLHA
ncbi:DegT/DnrJ/EryC1/StrS family aminotransferase [Xylanibacillus composti]|uniref:DegT/DnrJ/EryC1/StrS family aminotransferase n=1 Tax=Xylanibacillus composti TaxID=1572762 RepID=A0A8J4H1U5_9BACL|nr:DegT/DnrJ/EryC1/StrS family aminotransferase [Xylanibacillus composti]MDT9726195.1 DegT/DnrJ/EryC1/StrS family aminotransferase [Xylanibacillus composti]GIQ68041.1 DegT/DnrJ/EryC1/StrS family aminotransferase [Xylanibacillus composti]